MRTGCTKQPRLCRSEMASQNERSGRDAAATPRPAAADRMETAHCIVRLKGDVQNEVPLSGITAPEIILLRAIHGGNDAVYKVEKDSDVASGAVNERIRLLAKYPRYTELFAQLFPGLAPQFPRTIAEVEA